MKIGRSIRHYTYGLILLDSFGWIISFIGAYWARNPALFPHVSPEYIVILPFVVPVLLLSFHYFRLYHSRFGLVMEAIQIGKATVLGMLVIFAFLFFYRVFSFSRLFSITYVVLSFITVLFIRILYHRAFSRIMRSIRWQWKILIAGGGPIGRQIIDEIIEKPTEYRIVGFLDDDEDVCCEGYKSVRCLGKTT